MNRQNRHLELLIELAEAISHRSVNSKESSSLNRAESDPLPPIENILSVGIQKQNVSNVHRT